MVIHNTIAYMNPETPQRKENFLKEIVKFTLMALAIVIPLRTFVAEPFIVSGASMDPTFETGQYLVVDQLSYDFNTPQRGDVVIFKYPNDPKLYFIKRIIGLPGETLSMDTGKVTIINKDSPAGLLLPEPYITKDHQTSDTFSIKLGPTEYFVMGDNRPQSSDSRSWGPLESKFIIGRPILRLIPFSQISVFPGR